MLGSPGEIELVVKLDNKLCFYKTNIIYGDFDISELYKIIPWLEKLQIGLGYVRNIPSEFKHIYTGFGNHLFLRSNLYSDMEHLLKGQNVGVIYASWKKWCIKIYSKN